MEEQIRGVREDVAELTQEMGRARARLHKLEGLTGMMVEQQKHTREAVAERQRRLELRIQVLTLVVGLAAVVAPLVAVLLATHS